jgi:hypothetical protein
MDFIAKLLLRIVATNCSLQSDVIASCCKLLLQTVIARLLLQNCCYSLFSEIVVIEKWLLQIVTATVVVTKMGVASCYRKLLLRLVVEEKLLLQFVAVKCLQDRYCQLLFRNCYWTVVRDCCFKLVLMFAEAN